MFVFVVVDENFGASQILAYTPPIYSTAADGRRDVPIMLGGGKHNGMAFNHRQSFDIQ